MPPLGSRVSFFFVDLNYCTISFNISCFFFFEPSRGRYTFKASFFIFFIFLIFVIVFFHFFECFQFFSSVSFHSFLKVLSFGEVIDDARCGRARHPPTNQSFRVREDNLATLKVATKKLTPGRKGCEV